MLVRELQQFGTDPATHQPALVALLVVMRERLEGWPEDRAFVETLMARAPGGGAPVSGGGAGDGGTTGGDAAGSGAGAAATGGPSTPLPPTPSCASSFWPPIRSTPRRSGSVKSRGSSNSACASRPASATGSTSSRPTPSGGKTSACTS